HRIAIAVKPRKGKYARFLPFSIRKVRLAHHVEIMRRYCDVVVNGGAVQRKRASEFIVCGRNRSFSNDLRVGGVAGYLTASPCRENREKNKGRRHSIPKGSFDHGFSSRASAPIKKTFPWPLKIECNWLLSSSKVSRCAVGTVNALRSLLKNRYFPSG